MKKSLAKFRDKLALVKFQFDVGFSLLTLINFSLLIVAASDKIQELWDVSVLGLGLFLVPVALVGTWAFGWFLDKVVRYQDSYYKTQTKRIPQFMEMLEVLKVVEKRLDQIENKLEAKNETGQTVFQL